MHTNSGVSLGTCARSNSLTISCTKDSCDRDRYQLVRDTDMAFDGRIADDLLATISPLLGATSHAGHQSTVESMHLPVFRHLKE